MFKAIIIILAIVFPVLAQPSVKLEVGRSTITNVYFVETSLDYKHKFVINKINIFSQTYGNYLSWQNFDSKNFGFNVAEITFKFGQKIIYKNIFVKFEHYCSHPIINDATGYYDFRRNYYFEKLNISPYWWRGTQETISFGVEYTFK